jgi:hypothetical protein
MKDGVVVLEVSGLDELRLLSAFQVLGAWRGAYRVTFKRAREVIKEITGLTPIRGRKPERPTGDDVIQGYLDWLVQNSKKA